MSQNPQMQVVIRTQHIFLKWCFCFFSTGSCPYWVNTLVTLCLYDFCSQQAAWKECYFYLGGHDIINLRNLKFLLKKKQWFSWQDSDCGERKRKPWRTHTRVSILFHFKNWLLFLLTSSLMSQKNMYSFGHRKNSKDFAFSRLGVCSRRKNCGHHVRNFGVRKYMKNSTPVYPNPTQRS